MQVYKVVQVSPEESALLVRLLDQYLDAFEETVDQMTDDPSIEDTDQLLELVGGFHFEHDMVVAMRERLL